MKIIILAAGKGSRLGKPGWPKPLTELETGQSILGHQLSCIAEYTSLDDVLIVVGFKKEKIMEAFPDLLYLFNPRFVEENTSKSLLRALYKIPAGEDVLWINGDVVFHSAALRAVLAESRSCMAVMKGSVGEEEVKYQTDASGKILEVSKQVEKANGEAVGINLFKADDVDVLRYQLKNGCSDTDYFEKGIQCCIDAGMDVFAVEIGRGLCMEIDFAEDLKRADALMKTWK